MGVSATSPQPLQAGEVFGGVQVHDVKTGLTASGIEDGLALQLGWRGDSVQALRVIGSPSPHAFVSVNSEGGANFASAGMSWKIGRTLYLRPGMGLAVHDGPKRYDPDKERIVFGSRILFAPEIGLGISLNERTSIEASWVHLSHGQLFGRNNPGLDNIGMRLNYRFR